MTRQMRPSGLLFSLTADTRGPATPRRIRRRIAHGRGSCNSLWLCVLARYGMGHGARRAMR